MTFLNMALLFGAAACAVPLAIHLLNRNRFQSVPWGAMHLLEEIIRVNRRRVRLEQLILLLIRMAIPVVLALVMAAPVLTGFHALSGDAKSSLVTLFDNSYSMEAGDDVDINFERAKQQAVEIITSQPRGSDLSLVLMAGGKVGKNTRITTDLEQSAQALAELQPGFGAADVASAIETGAELLPRMQHAKRDVLIISDFQANDWGGDDAPSREQALELVQSQPLQPTVTLLPVKRSAPDNLCIHSLDVSPSVVAVGEQFEIRANVRNHGKQLHPALQVLLRVDGKDTDSKEIELGADEDGQVVFRHTFDTPGSHVVELTADIADSLETDNRYHAAIHVWDRVSVVMVDGDPSDEPLKGETGFLQIALNPFSLAEAVSLDPDGPPAVQQDIDVAELFEITTLRESDFDASSLGQQHVLVLANVARLSDQQIEAVEAFVRDGNALLLFPGDQSEADWYNERLWNNGSGLLPLEMLKLHTSIAENGEERDSRSADTSIAAEQFDHPVFTLFNDKRNGHLADGRIESWYQLDNTGEGRANSLVLARLSGGSPLFAEKTYGEGRVIQCATACDDSWSNLPVRPFYLPMMQRLVTYLAGSVEPPRNVTTGETLTAFLPAEQAGKTATLALPTGKSVELPIRQRRSRALVEYARTERRGLYTLRVGDGDAIDFVVDAPRTESNVRSLNDQQLQDLAKSMNGTVVSSAAGYLSLDSTRRYGREIWRPLFWLLLLLLLGELLLQQLFSNQLKRSTRFSDGLTKARNMVTGVRWRAPFWKRGLPSNPPPPAGARSLEEFPIDRD